MSSKLIFLAAFLVACVPWAEGQLQVSNIDVSDDRQVAIRVEAGTEGGFYRLEYLTDESTQTWQQDARALFESGSDGPQFYTRLPSRVDARYFRAVWSEADERPSLRFSEIASDNVQGPQSNDGTHPDWIEFVNSSDQPLPIGAYGVGDDPDRLFKVTLPNMTLASGERYVLYLTDFGIDADGETIYLTAPSGLIQSIRVPALDEDESLASRGDDWFVMSPDEATPGQPNTEEGGSLYVPTPRFSIRGGRFEKSVTVRLVAVSQSHTVRFTTDGAEPDDTSPLYEQPFVIDGPMAIRARSFDSSGGASAVATQTYLVGVKHTLPIVAMTAPPENFEFHRGYLYGMGSVLSSSGTFRTSNSYPYSSSNAWKNREVKTNFELFEPDGERGFNMIAGLKIFGGWGSRGYTQKSFAVFARKKYGFKKIRYQLFPDVDVHDFETFVLRNSGNDNQSTHLTYPRSEIREFGPAQSFGSYFVNGNFTLFRDAMLTSLGRELGLDTQAYRPAVVYLNGDYWGIYNIREKLNEHYVESHYDVPDNQVDLIEGYGSANSGSASAYNSMRSLVNRTNTDEEYARVGDEFLDIANTIDYYLSVIFFQNFDIGNIKCWRSRVKTDDGRFRWLLYDQDYGFNLWPQEVYQPAMARDFADYRNMFDFYTNRRGSGWPNGSDRTLILRKLLGMEVFETRFILRCADLLNSTFKEEHLLARINEMADVVRPEIPRHLSRWSWESVEARGFGRPHKKEDAPLDLARWESNVQSMSDFASARPSRVREDLISHFDLANGLATVQFTAEPSAQAGSVTVNTLSLAEGDVPWSGIYFTDYAPPITATPSVGYRFVGWVGPVQDPNAMTTVPILVEGQTAEIRAQFETDQ